MSRGEEQHPNEEAIIEQAYKTAIESVTTASLEVLRYWPNPTNPRFEKDLVLETFEKEGIGNYATIADLRSEKIIEGAFASNPLLKDFLFLGEESEREMQDTQWKIIADPIDGTLNFSNGLKTFGISVGVVRDQTPLVGVIALPAEELLLIARKGKGAFLQSFEGKTLANLKELQRPIAVDKALVAYDVGYAHREQQLKNVIGPLSDTVAYAPCYGSISYGNAQLAQGLLGGFFVMTPTVYDLAAAAAILPEIDGFVSDRNGNPLDWNQPPKHGYVAARNQELHRHIVNFTKQRHG